MRAYVRRKFNEGLKVAESFVPTFDVPVTQAFGDVAAEGTSESFSRGDHRHGMPDLDSFVLDLQTSTMYLNELLILTNSSNIQVIGGTPVFGGLDTTGHLGGFGTISVPTSAGSATSGVAILVMQSTVASTTQSLHLWKRTQVFQTRVRPVFTTSELVSCFLVVGGVKTSTTVRADLVTDGVYFYCATDGTGAGNWFAQASVGGTTTSVDTGRAPRTSGTDVEFQNFRIDYDLDTNTASFFIGDSSDLDDDGNVVMAPVATITTNIPTSANKICGWGAITTNATAVSRTLAADYFAISGRRQYSE